MQVPYGDDIRLDDVMECIQSLKKGSNCWRLLLTLLGGIPWHLLQERNRRSTVGEAKPRELVASKILKDCKLCVDVGLLESSAL